MIRFIIFICFILSQIALIYFTEIIPKISIFITNILYLIFILWLNLISYLNYYSCLFIKINFYFIFQFPGIIHLFFCLIHLEFCFFIFQSLIPKFYRLRSYYINPIIIINLNHQYCYLDYHNPISIFVKFLLTLNSVFLFP